MPSHPPPTIQSTLLPNSQHQSIPHHILITIITSPFHLTQPNNSHLWPSSVPILAPPPRLHPILSHATCRKQHAQPPLRPPRRRFSVRFQTIASLSLHNPSQQGRVICPFRPFFAITVRSYHRIEPRRAVRVFRHM